MHRVSFKDQNNESSGNRLSTVSYFQVASKLIHVKSTTINRTDQRIGRRFFQLCNYFSSVFHRFSLSVLSPRFSSRDKRTKTPQHRWKTNETPAKRRGKRNAQHQVHIYFPSQFANTTGWTRHGAGIFILQLPAVELRRPVVDINSGSEI